jgi:hypothetical protein
MSRSAPRFTTPTDRVRRVAGDPFLARLGLLAVAAVIITPIVAVAVRSDHHDVVDSGRLPGAAVAVGPAGETTTVATTVPPAVLAAPAPASLPPTVATPGTLPAIVAPPTTQPTTTDAIAAVAQAPAAERAPSTKRAPTTTEAPEPPTTPAPPPPPPTTEPRRDWGQSEVIQIIRSVWPDDLEEHALYIAHRESNFIPTARNYCCVGLFQIYASVHEKLINSLGFRVDQLTDPLVNSVVAYALYQRAGWGPWGG